MAKARKEKTRSKSRASKDKDLKRIKNNIEVLKKLKNNN